jgi:carbonic anhydrase
MSRWVWLAALLAAAVTMSCGGPPEPSIESAETHSSAAHEDAEDDSLYALPGLGHGLIQSPVNILTDNPAIGRHTIHTDFRHTRAASIVNTGHTIELDFEPGSTIAFDDKSYELKQCHFHTPSEHLIDGVTYPMEMHCVHLRPEAEATEGRPEYLVVGFLFKMGAENRFIDEFLNRAPGSPASTELSTAEPVYIEDLLNPLPDSETEHFYTYKGSLTTPPYTETVTWVLTQRIFEASPEQIQTINRIEGNNARHVQSLYSRHVEGM